jgi:hypothetical protein
MAGSPFFLKNFMHTLVARFNQFERI